MAVEGTGSGSSALAFLVSAGLMYEVIAAACSSPQTTEINAKSRSSTLMKWVKVGMAQGVVLVGISIFIEPSKAVPLAAGGGLAAGLMWASYVHANAAGLASCEPGTES